MASRFPSDRDRSRSRRSGPTARPRATAPRAGRGGKSDNKPVGSGPQVTTRAVILLSVVLLLVASYTASFRAWWSARQEIQATQAERTMLKKQVEQLKEEKVRFDDPAFVRQQARERFGWVMPGEVGYRVIGADGTVRGEVGSLDEPRPPAQQQWYGRVWESVQTAGAKDGDVAPQPAPDKPLVEKPNE